MKVVRYNLASSSYHPGQTERVNQCLETYLRCMVINCPRKWVRWLPHAQYWYNTNLPHYNEHLVKPCLGMYPVWLTLAQFLALMWRL